MIINWFGPIGPSGYGIFTRFLVPALEKQGHNINVIAIYPQEYNVAKPEIKRYVNVMDEMILNADVGIRLSIANPSDAFGFYGKKRIMFNMLEVDKIPPFWAKSLNTVDRVWVPSTWMKEVYKKSGVIKPIDVVPGGVDLNLFNEYREPLIQKDGKFRFLFVGKWEHRKGIDILLKAYADEFKKDEDVELVLLAESIKMFIPNFNIYRELFDLRLASDRAKLKIIEGMIPDYKGMGRLYRSCDCFVKPTRGEGWNLPLIEAMACGLPSIVTNHSAHTDYANEKNAYLLNDFKMIPAIHPRQLAQAYLQFGKWAEPSVKELREKMRYVFDNQDEAKKVGQKAAKDMKKWTWNEAAKKAIKHLEKVIK